MNSYSSFLSDDHFAIFLFHGVIPRRRHAIRNYTNKHLMVDRFVSIIRDLCSSGVAISLHDIVNANRNNLSLPRRGFAITFDDGFENNYSVAAPILRDMNVPATFYITTNFIDKNALSWIDMIEFAVENKRWFRLGPKFPEIQGVYETHEGKIALLDKIRKLIKTNPTLDPYIFSNEFCCELDVGTIEPDADLDQKMSWAQVRSLNEDDLFTIGGHGHTHRVLAFLEPKELGYEISVSIEKLSTCVGEKIEHYSYPEGLSYCYSDDVITTLRKNGIVSAPTAEHGLNRVGDDLFRLKRIMVI